jgi:transmembrane sensor
MTNMPDRIEDEALGWIIRLREADAAGWDEFTQWLEADRAHLDAYEKLASFDASFDNLSKPTPPLRAAQPPSRQTSRRGVIGWALAAALVATLGYSNLHQVNDRYEIVTGPGKKRSLALSDGSKIHLNGASLIELDRSDLRFARLKYGEALFEITHDPSSTFRVEVAGGVVRDLGTIFNIVHDRELFKVEVAEGAASYDSAGQQVNLAQGETLRKEGKRLISGRKAASEIGVWSKGHLSYSSASVTEIAADLSRSTGVPVRASPEVGRNTFSGVIMLDTDSAALIRRAASLLGVDARPDQEGWLLTRR